MDVQLELLLLLEPQLAVYCLHWKKLHHGKIFLFLDYIVNNLIYASMPSVIGGDSVSVGWHQIYCPIPSIVFVFSFRYIYYRMSVFYKHLRFYMVWLNFKFE